MKRDATTHSIGERLPDDGMNNLRLGAARKRLANCRGQADAIEAVREIVSNFLGSEEMALFDFRSPEARRLWSFGTNADKCDLLDVLNEKARGNIARGHCQVEDLGGTPARPAKKVQAFVPIRLGNQTVGVLAILQLLPQKASFDASDMDILKLLSDEAGTALFESTSSPPA